MQFKYKTFEIEVNEFDYWNIYNSLREYMWKTHQNDYESYMNECKEYYESVAEEQRAEYDTRYDVEFALSCVSANYERNIEQESRWIVDRWQDQFNGITQSRIARKRKNMAREILSRRKN